MAPISSRPSDWKITISSMRLRNSGRRVCRSVSSTQRPHLRDLVVLPEEVAAEVRGHDDHRVAEVHRAALAVGETAVVQHLEQHVEHVRVRLLDLVEEDDRVGPAAHRLRELAALVVAHVAGGRADEPSHRVLFHVLRHVDADHRPLVVEEELGERPRQLRLAHAGGPEEEEGADGAVRVGQARARAADRVGHRHDGLALADHPLAQPLLHLDELLHLGLEQAGRPGCPSTWPPSPRCPPRRPPP